MSRPLKVHFMFVVVAGLLTAHAPSYAQNSQPYWASAGPAVSGGFMQSLVFDDGTGEGLFLRTTTGIYRWRDGGWDVIAARGVLGLSEYVNLYIMAPLDLNGARSLYLVGVDEIRRYDPPITNSVGFECWTKRWTGTSWVAAPDGLAVGGVDEPYPYRWPMLSMDLGDGPRVYGNVALGPGTHQFHVGRWNGIAWEVIGLSNTFTGPLSLFSFNNGNGTALYAFGQFTQIGGTAARGFAKWDGEQWRSLYSGLVSRESSDFNCVTFDDGSGPALFCANGGGWINGEEPGFLNKWDGQTWSVIPSIVVPPKTLTTINGIAVFDDGRGPALYITGGWGNVQGVAASGIARFDGTTWEPLGAGIPYPQHGPRPNSLQVMNDPRRGPSLFVGATRAGGGVVPKYAQWVGTPNCYADCDLDRALTVADFVCFISMFASTDPYANCTVDATIDAADFTCFLNRYAAGCP